VRPVVFGGVRPPVGVAGKKTETFDLEFWLATSTAKEVGEVEIVNGEPRLQLSVEPFVLEIEDYVSGAKREFPEAGVTA
jgi:hypothetical protein